jgi:arsenate reductase (glutaredoxin)
MIKIYHNPRCRKSRAGLQYLKDNVDDFEIIEYLKNPITADELISVLKKLGKKPFEMVRTQEADYKTNYKGKEFSDNEWIEIIINNPKLLKRPIVVKDNKAVWADPAEVLADFL